MGTTIYEIAQKAGVSVATVSRVLNRKANIKKETRDRVLSVIERLNYYPRVSSRTKTKRIGIIVPPFRNLFRSYYVTEVLTGITNYDFTFTCELTFFPRNIFSEEPKELFYVLKTENIFFAIFLYGLVEDYNHILFTAEKRFPHIVIGGKYPKEKGINWIDADNSGAISKVVRYLISLGHCKIGLINTPKYLVSSQERLESYQRTLKENGMEKKAMVLFSKGTKPEDGYEAAIDLFTHNTAPTAVIAGNDRIALGVYKALAELGYRVPEDISVVGSDDIPLSEHLVPSLTTIHVPWEEIGRRVAEIIQMYHTTGELPSLQEVVEANLILRNSTGLPRKTG